MFRKLSVIFVLLAVMLCISSCDRRLAKFLPNRPDTSFTKELEDASPDFRQGWTHGCESGMASGSNTFYKAFYRTNVVDGYKMTGSSDYKNAWGNGFWYCYRYDYGKQSSPIWGSTFGGYR
jgi:hypothetical protein